MTYTVNHFIETFREYSNACAENDYTKLEYSIWREIKNCLKQTNIEIRLKYSKMFQDVVLIITCDDEKILQQQFPIKPYTFGEYLYKTYPKEYTTFYSPVVKIDTDSLYTVANSSDTWTMTINNDNKENNEMNTNNMFGHFDFGPVKENVRLSMYGLAVVGQDGRYIAYDAATDSMVDVEVFNFSAQSILYKMPVAIKDIKAGDTVIHLRKPMYVKEVKGTDLAVVDYVSGEEKVIKPVKNMFGFNFYTKVVNFLENAMPTAETANADNPFGNMWMLALMGDENVDFNPMIAMMLASQNGNAITANPFVLMALMGNNKLDNNNLLPMLAMSQMMNASKAE